MVQGESTEANTTAAGSGTLVSVPTSTLPKPNKVEGQLWMKQANLDFEILQYLFEHCKESTNSKWFGTICFLAQQVAEKALKSGFL